MPFGKHVTVCGFYYILWFSFKVIYDRSKKHYKLCKIYIKYGIIRRKIYKINKKEGKSMKKILFSPIGGTDPISNFRDGAMLHICRIYKPCYDVWI